MRFKGLFLEKRYIYRLTGNRSTLPRFREKSGYCKQKTRLLRAGLW